VQATPVLPGDWVIVLPLVLALMTAAVLVMLREAARVGFVLALLAVGAIVASEVALLLRVLESGPVSMTMGNWLPPFGISFTARSVRSGFRIGRGGGDDARCSST
jgi:multicomponent Na+:H+ antiporter subunit D